MAKKKTKDGTLAQGITAFESGDFLRARALLNEASTDQSLPEGARKMAKSVANATRIDKATLLVGLTCIPLLLVAILVGFLKQP